MASRVNGRDIPLGHTANGQTLSVMRTLYVAETQEQAEKEARVAVNSSMGRSTSLRKGWSKKGMLAADEELTNDELNSDWFDFLQAKEMIWVGSPDNVAEKIDRLRSELNCQHVILWPNPIVSFEASQRSFALFAERVMPLLQKEEALVT